MEQRPLGSSEIVVSPICLGTMTFGQGTDFAEAERIVGAAHEAGVNFIDTADIYADGESERMVGRLLASDRARWVVATKCGSPMGGEPDRRGLSRRWITTAVHDSLRRLGMDHIDVYYAHLDDEATPLEETLRAFGDLVRSGDIRAIGLSNYRGWRIAEAVHLCREMGVPPPVVCQPYYHAFNRTAEVEVLPACAHLGLGVVPYSPLARGLLSGKYSPDAAPPADSRAGRSDGMAARMRETEWSADALVLAQRVRGYAEAKGMTAGQFALAWVLRNALVTSVMPGPRTLEQWLENLGALDHDLDPEDEAFVDSLVAPGHPATPGYNDPIYPLRGRIARS